jgi:hypothetical protein
VLARRGPDHVASEYGYREGVILGGAGHLRVTVSPESATVAFIRAQTTEVGHSYDVSAAR